MNKGELVSAIAEKSGLTKKDSEKALNAFLESVEESLGKKDDVNILNFGSFRVKHRVAREGRNPQTGDKMTIPAKDVVVFVPGKNLKDSVN